MQNIILYLIGFPGTGKYTIAQEICQRNTTFRLVDSHLINNPLFAVIPIDGKSPIPQRVWDNQDKIWDAVFDVMVHVSPPAFSFVLTNYLSQNNPSDVAWFGEVEKMSAKRNARFVPVCMTIDTAEHQKRITQENRQARMKMTDPDAPRRFKEEDTLVTINHPNLLSLDVTNLQAADAATRIIKHIEKLQDKPDR